MKKILHSHCKGEELQGPEKKKNSSLVAKAKENGRKKIKLFTMIFARMFKHYSEVYRFVGESGEGARRGKD